MSFLSGTAMIPDNPVPYGLYADRDGKTFHALPACSVQQGLPNAKAPLVTWDTIAYRRCVESDAREHMQRLGVTGELKVYELHYTFTKEDWIKPIKGFKIR